eukprot:scaffold32422_cov94-Isochrysis_galbana.AAC.1
MEAAARQFATGKRALVLRNGFFSYRWTQIFDQAWVRVHSREAETRIFGPAAPVSSMPVPTLLQRVYMHPVRPVFYLMPASTTRALWRLCVRACSARDASGALSRQPRAFPPAGRFPARSPASRAKPIDALKNVDGRRAARHGMSVAEGGGLWEGDLNTQKQYAPHPIDKVGQLSMRTVSSAVWLA